MKRLLLLVLWPAAALAGEVKLDGMSISAALSDKSLYADNVEQIFQKTGQTIYLDHGNSSQGTWKVDGNQYCSQWPPSESWACYDVVRDGDTITFVSASGTRYAMRLQK